MTALPMTTLTRLAPAPDTAATDVKTLRRRPVLAKEGHPAVRPVAAAHLTDEDVAELGRELDAIRDAVLADRGAKDAAYIRRVIRTQRSLEIGGRACLVFASLPPAWVAGVAMLSVAKILENMEIGHNVLHGQWDWMRDPDIHSTTWEWDFVTPAGRVEAHAQRPAPHVDQRPRQGPGRGLRHPAHGPDEQPWQPLQPRQPGSTTSLLAPFFEWGIAVYDLELEDVAAGQEVHDRPAARASRRIGRKIATQFTKDYVATPASPRPLRSVPALARHPHRQRDPQRLGARGHLLRPLPRRRRHVHRGEDRGRDPRRLVRPPDDRLGQHLAAARPCT